MWALGDTDNPGSGSGSSLDATANIRKELPDLLRTVNVRCLLDIGCGDFTWMKELDLSGFEYVGWDIVSGVVDENRLKYGRNNVRFVHGNAVGDELPDADVILAREIFFHLSFEDIFAALRNIFAKPRAWLLITSDHLSSFNADIRSGDWRLLNLQKPPFNFPAPIYSIDDSGVCPDRKLLAWRADQIRRVLDLNAS
jgi:SAM-dependent methyltransferase